MGKIVTKMILSESFELLSIIIMLKNGIRQRKLIEESCK